MPKIATADRVGRDQLIDFVRTRHRVSLVTTRRDGRPQISPVIAGVDDEQRIVISTYPDRAKAANLRRNPAVAVLVHSDDWAEYRGAMRRQGKSLIRIAIDSWGPIATGGFPPDRAPSA